jgi:thiamine-phosphate pyrophosphorylase
MKLTSVNEVKSIMERHGLRFNKGYGQNFLINEAVPKRIAAECGADGVHLGQDDMTIDEARRLYPELKIFGLSTHNLRQAKESIAINPDYIGTGPVFPTPTKEIPDPTLGIADAVKMANLVSVPAVAIGGINANNIADVIKSGIRNFAIVRAVCAADNPYEAIISLNEIAAKAREES